MAALSHLRNKKESKLRDGIDKVWSVDSSLWQIGHFILDHGQVWGWDSGLCKRRELSWRHAHIQYCPGQKGNIQDQQGRASYHYCFHLMSGPGHFFWAPQNSFQFNNFDPVSFRLHYQISGFFCHYFWLISLKREETCHANVSVLEIMTMSHMIPLNDS